MDNIALAQELETLRRRETQMLGAAISLRNWQEVEAAYNQLRDRQDGPIAAALRTPAPAHGGGDVVALRSITEEIAGGGCTCGAFYRKAGVAQCLPCRAREALQAQPTASTAQPDDAVELAADCDGKEQDAFEAWATFENHAPALAAMQQQECHAVLRYDRTTPGNENEMPKVLSCNWLPDGEYQVFLRPQQAPVADDVRQADKDLFKLLTNPDADTADLIDRGLAFTAEIELIAAYRLTQPQPDAAVAVERWQPIETAPHNQSVILAWQDWRDGTWSMEIGPASTGQRFANGFSSVSHHGRATHWQPRPTPPASIRAGGQQS